MFLGSETGVLFEIFRAFLFWKWFILHHGTKTMCDIKKVKWYALCPMTSK